MAKPAAVAPKPKAAPKPKDAPEGEAAPEAEAAPEPEAAASAQVDITPVARKLAEEHGLDLDAIEGTGKDGRILKSDVDKAIAAKEGD
ncbi:MAG: E3 binding domain-containing protein [Gemmatimonadetes bacterium]|nr:E3 binding domain-containing protein [Candidatus Palauibacter australiensis]